MRLLIAALVCTSLFLSTNLPALAKTPPAKKVSAAEADAVSKRRVISLADYIAGDYSGAISQGKVINKEEYQEQIDFAATIGREFGKIKGSISPDQSLNISNNISALHSLILAKADTVPVAATAKVIKDLMIAAFDVPFAPTTSLSLIAGQSILEKSCQTCHGANGHGDGPLSKGMEPPPRNFHDAEVMNLGSPFRFYNALILGVEGTPMVSFAPLYPNEQLWSAAFFTASIRHSARPEFKGKNPQQIWESIDASARQALLRNGLSLAKLARDSDDDLRHWIRTTLGASVERNNERVEVTLGALRAGAPWLEELPLQAAVLGTTQRASSADGSAPVAQVEPVIVSEQISQLTDRLLKTREAVTQVRSQFNAGQSSEADTALLDIYLNQFEGTESFLRSRDKPLVSRIEAGFLDLRRLARAERTTKAIETFDKSADALTRDLTDAHALVMRIGLNQQSAGSSSATSESTGDFLASFIIILREGFEAFLIVAAILAAMTSIGATRAKRWIHAGWISACIAGYGTFLIFQHLIVISGAGREMIEGVSTAIAGVVLFYVSFWLISQSEKGAWEKFIRNNVTNAMQSTKLWTLFFLAFVAVYREAAETALFYQALVTSAKSVWSVGLGFCAGVAILAMVCLAIVKNGVKLPLRKFFMYTSVAMIAIAVVLMGKSVKEFAEAGKLTPTILSHLPSIDVLGFYPYVESIAVQLVFIGFAFAMVHWAKRRGGSTGTPRAAVAGK